MRDADRLRTYFDAVVERVDVDDVMARLSVQDQVRRRRPAVALAVSFVAAFAAVGSLLILAMLAPEDGSGADVSTDEFLWLVDAPAAVGPTVAVVAVALVGAALVGGLLWIVMPAYRHRTTRKDETMKTMEREVDIGDADTVEDLKRQRRLLVVLITFLVVTTIGFGAWAISMTGDDDLSVVALDGELTARQQEMLDFLAEDGPWGTAWNGGVGEDMAALFASNGYYAGMDGKIYRQSDGTLASILGLVGGRYPDVSNQVVVGDHVILVLTDGTVAAFELTAAGPLQIISLLAAG
ncbi:MAG: hypothetical protein QNJ88_12340 [Acidimicrobiia bacterium]|nr:hypothetical protein [Acidimicrobiia bacterium]